LKIIIYVKCCYSVIRINLNYSRDDCILCRIRIVIILYKNINLTKLNIYGQYDIFYEIISVSLGSHEDLEDIVEWSRRGAQDVVDEIVCSNIAGATPEARRWKFVRWKLSGW